MKLVVIILAFGSLATTAVLIWRRMESPAKAPRTFESADEYTQFMSEQAVKDAEKEDQVRLDYSVDSIRKVDEVLGRVHGQYMKDKSSVRIDALANAYGAYIGEVIRRSEPGVKWDRDHHVAGPRSYPLHWGTGDAFPMACCYRRMTGGDEDSVWTKYYVFKQQAHAEPRTEPR